ncbi:unnamed protein product [Bursaphelenchus xylophilus]|uniref:Aminopeptidase n=1 Tax=Bursaphelenchus xylophilus TaxID=6326 RepID=A0A1I7RVL6_BURXY|nr:unnamed protein product [Bursaphelenchus xylophilus]CAG9081857.1 unnamed protein product [Bursaphelenchus xylophilus]
MLRFLLIFPLLCLCGISIRPPRTSRTHQLGPVETNDCLPHTVEVHHYNLTLDPTFAYYGYEFPPEKLNTFTGSVDITFSVLNATNQIELNSAVNISATRLSDDSVSYTITSQETTAGNHLKINTKETLPVSKNFTLSFKFNGHLDNSFHAFYHVDYVEKDGKKTALVATLLEEIDARKVFPCFDDPFFKSTFKFTVYHPKGSQALSNGEIESQRDFGKQTITEFTTTVKMPVYLFAVGVGDFVESSTKSKRGVVVRTYAKKQSAGFIQETAEVAANIIDVMENLTGIPYPLEKLDHLDTISMAEGGAMENFGLIIYAGCLTGLIDEDASSKYGRLILVGHETSHQWFGDLVTAKRWGLEYLHESFATFFESEIFRFIPEFKYPSIIGFLQNYREAKSVAEYENHPIEDKISHFDHTTYDVGGALLASVKHLVSEEVFYDALHIYLNENSFGNADTELLAAAFDEALKKTQGLGFNFSEEYLKPYLRQIGIPTVEISLNDQNQYVIKQIPFQDQTTWLVPLFIYNLDKLEESRLDVRNDPVIMNSTDILLFNSNFKTFASVNLDDKVKQRAAAHKNAAKLLPENQLLYLKEYDESGFAGIVKGNDGKVEPLLVDYLLNLGDKELLELISKKFDFKPTPENRFIAPSLLQQAVQNGVESVVDTTQHLFDQFVKDCGPEKDVVHCTSLPPEFRVGIYSQGIKKGDGKKFLSEYRTRVEQHPQGDFLSPEIDRLRQVLGG